MTDHEIKFIRFTNGEDIVTEVVSETKTTITIKSAMKLMTDVDIENGTQSLILYPWFPHGVLLANEITLKKKDIMWLDYVEDDIEDYYVKDCLEVFGDNQHVVSSKVVGAKSSLPNSNNGSNVLEFNRKLVRNIGNTSI